MTDAQDQELMGLALKWARQAAAVNEVPVGAVVAHQGVVVGQAHNRRELDQDPTAHAEILALRQAAAAVGSWRLGGCTLYVTLEPCPMCAGALVHARIQRLVYGCDDPKSGAVRSLYTLCQDSRLNHRLQVDGGVLADQCGQLLKDFFGKLRQSQRTAKSTPP